MRLYDQSSSTPILLNTKKLMCPLHFLPKTTRNITRKLDPNLGKGKNEVERIRNDISVSDTSEYTSTEEVSKAYKHNNVFCDDFRFDINDDQDIFSLGSSSTLSTHPSFYQRNNHCEAVTDEPNNFSRNPSGDGNGYGSYDDDDEFFTPELTLTESSEDSVWFDFPGSEENNPFCNGSSNKYDNNEGKNSASNCPTLHHHETNTYTKYLTSLVRGISVTNVSQDMKNDKVNPSIIALVLAANKANSYV